MWAYVDIAKIAQIVGLITSVAIVLSVVAGAIWYAIKGRKLVTFKDATAEAQSLAATRKEKIAELEKEIGDLTKERDACREQRQLDEEKLNNATQSILELHARNRRLRRNYRALEHTYFTATGHRPDPKEIELNEEDFDS
jgi:septal ring factor EnvC (AmiA/AmiB activator)